MKRCDWVTVVSKSTTVVTKLERKVGVPELRFLEKCRNTDVRVRRCRANVGGDREKGEEGKGEVESGKRWCPL